jgi:hypothetical protein
MEKQSVELSPTLKKVGNVNVDQHWEYPEEMSTGYVAT